MVRQGTIYAALIASTAVFAALLYSHFTAPLDLEELDFEPINVTLADPESVIDRFAGLLRFNTVSSLESDNHVLNPAEFLAQNKYIRKTWPTIFKKLDVREVSSSLYFDTWPHDLQDGHRKRTEEAISPQLLSPVHVDCKTPAILPGI